MQFILNQQLISTSLPEGSTLVDFIRYNRRLTGTKIGCREGDCGACTVLCGAIENGRLFYRPVTSCLMPLVNAAGKHIVTVEGIAMDGLSPVQQAMVDTNGTQCGFCTTGFIMSLTGFVADPELKETGDAITYMDGNICRCTGYKSIERAASLIASRLENKPAEHTLRWLVEKHFLPSYFADMDTRISRLRSDVPSGNADQVLSLGGGTDMVVQQHAQVKKSSIRPLLNNPALKNITLDGAKCTVGSAVTVAEFAASPVIRAIFPGLENYIRLVSSTPIRNMPPGFRGINAPGHLFPSDLHTHICNA